MNARRVKALRRRQLATLRRTQLETVESFLEDWSELMGGLPDYYGCTMTCYEAESVAALYRAFGHTKRADTILEHHAEYDDCGDAHHEPCDDCKEPNTPAAADS